MIRDTVACRSMRLWHDVTCSMAKEISRCIYDLDDGMAHVRTAFSTTEQHWTGNLQTAFCTIAWAGEEA